MSRARLTGGMPRPGEILAVLDSHAHSAATGAKNVVLPIVKSEAPGGLGDAMNGSVRKTPTGFRVTVQASPRKPYGGGEKPPTAARVTRWVNRGTGIYRKGPGAKRRIAPKSGGLMKLPGGREVYSVKGQHPNPFIARAALATMSAVRQEFAEGARQAARQLRRL